MPRASRVKSESGIYHIMLRGINQQVIFEQSEDYEKFMEILNKYKAISGYKVFAYCLMSNHIHLVIKEEKESIEQIIKRIAGSYVYWHNWKYYRKGHLFQDRFRRNTRGRFYCVDEKHTNRNTRGRFCCVDEIAEI